MLGSSTGGAGNHVHPTGSCVCSLTNLTDCMGTLPECGERTLALKLGDQPQKRLFFAHILYECIIV